MSSNNSFNIPLEDGEIIVGRTGLTPVAANITGASGGSMTVMNGAGSVVLSNMPLTTITINTIMVANHSYSIFDNDAFPIAIELPDFAAKGDTFEVSACGLVNLGFRVNVAGSQIIYGPVSSSPQNNIRFFVPGQPSSVKIRCIDDITPNHEIFQVVSHEGTPSTGP